MIETEIKLRIDDVPAARARLLALGAEIVRERVREDNTLYDFADGRLKDDRQVLRVRRTGRKAFVTFKGSPRKSRSFKVREEFESEVKSARDFARILAALGLRERGRYAKHRTVLRRGKVKVCLDETAAGAFVELEGKRSDIVRLARALGFARKDFITSSYPELLAGGAGRADG